MGAAVETSPKSMGPGADCIPGVYVQPGGDEDAGAQKIGQKEQLIDGQARQKSTREGFATFRDAFHEGFFQSHPAHDISQTPVSKARGRSARSNLVHSRRHPLRIGIRDPCTIDL